MFQEKKNSNFLQKTATDEVGLNGWFGRLAKKLLSHVASAVSSLAGPIGNEINGYLQGAISSIATESLVNTLEPAGLVFKTQLLTQDYEPTLAEENILTPWVTQNFTPFYRTLSLELENTMNQSMADNKIVGINAVLAKICVVKSHFAKYETAGLSALGIVFRNDFINESFKVLEQIIEVQTSGSGLHKVSVNFSMPASITGYEPLLYSTALQSVNCLRLQKEVFLLDPIKDGNTTTPIFGNTKPEVLPVGAENTIPQTLPVATNTKKEKNFLQKNGVWFAIAGVAIWAFSPDKKKSKK